MTTLHVDKQLDSTRAVESAFASVADPSELITYVVVDQRGQTWTTLVYDWCAILAVRTQGARPSGPPWVWRRIVDMIEDCLGLPDVGTCWAGALREWLGDPPSTCHTCKGSGKEQGPCLGCGGTGRRICECPNCGDEHATACYECSGSGVTPCRACDGSGKYMLDGNVVDPCIVWGQLVDRIRLSRLILPFSGPISVRAKPEQYVGLVGRSQDGEDLVALLAPVRDIMSPSIPSVPSFPG